jgi:sporulation protein YlmC with PRC-barrel domain
MDSIQASSLLQFNLLNDQGQNIGTIQDIVLNLQSGEVSYVAVNFSSLLGAGEKVFAVPYDDIWYNLNDRTVTIYNINASALEQKAGISQDNWPETADPNWNAVQ